MAVVRDKFPVIDSLEGILYFKEGIMNMLKSEQMRSEVMRSEQSFMDV